MAGMERSRYRAVVQNGLPPRLRLLDDVGPLRVLAQQLRPAGKRRATTGQRHGLTAVVLHPRDIEVFEQHPPRNPVHGEVVNDQRQLAR